MTSKTPTSFILKPVYVQLNRRTLKRFVLPPSLNARLHWAVRSKISRQWKNEVCWECKAAKVPKMDKALITLHVFTIRPRDRDNLYTSFKPILDGIVDAGVVKDDSDNHVEIKVINERVKHRDEEQIKITLCPTT